MPPFNQPIPLRNMSMDFLVNRLSNYCYEASTEGSLKKLREGITIIKEEICPHIPWHLSAVFHNRFLQEFFTPLSPYLLTEPPGSNKRAVLDIIMDRKIIGLKFRETILNLDVDDVRRIQGLTELDWNHAAGTEVLPILGNLRLEALKELTFEMNCEDTHLEIIGRNCPRLECLDVSGSEDITDEGLRALNKCRELRVVCIVNCPKLSPNGIHELLSGHEKIRRIHAWDRSHCEGFNCFSHSQSDSSVYPSIDTFAIEIDLISNQDLLTVVEKFPNLTSLRISGNVRGDLRTLSSLKKLTKLDLSFAIDFSYDNLKQLLLVIGANITDLRTCCTDRSASHVTQNDLNFLFNHCGNIEHLEFEYSPSLDEEILAIPPFEKLRVLQCFIPSAHRHGIAKLQFGKMLSLEMLTINAFHVTTESVETMVLDNVMFPNLKLIRTSRNSGFCDINRINEIARIKNLDFEIRDIHSFRR